MTGNDVRDKAAEQCRREVQLTEAWTPLFHHPVQQSLFWHTARFKSIPAARRTGKTALSRRRGVLNLVKSNVYAPRILYGAPTYSRAKELFFEQLIALIPKFWIKKIKESLNMMELRTHWGALIRLVGLQNPKVVEGVEWDDAFIDEFADCKKQSFELHLRPALATRGRPGSAWLMGVPDEIGENQAEHEKIFKRGLMYGKPEGDNNYCSFWWTSKEILEPEEFNALANEMDDLSFAQEMEGLFVRSGGKALPNFIEQVHVDDEYSAYSPFLNVDHIIDFGSANSASLIGQNYKGNAWILDEIPMHGGSTEGHCEAFIDRCGRNGYSLNRFGVFGDAAGRTPNSTTGKSDYETMAEWYRGYNVEWNQLYVNPNIKDTINAVRGRLLNRNGAVRLYVHSRCKNLIKQMNDAEWPPKNSLREYHFLACLRYYLFSLYGDTGAGNISGVSRATIATVSDRDQSRFSSRYVP